MLRGLATLVSSYISLLGKMEESLWRSQWNAKVIESDNRVGQSLGSALKFTTEVCHWVSHDSSGEYRDRSRLWPSVQKGPRRWSCKLPFPTNRFTSSYIIIQGKGVFGDLHICGWTKRPLGIVIDHQMRWSFPEVRKHHRHLIIWHSSVMLLFSYSIAKPKSPIMRLTFCQSFFCLVFYSPLCSDVFHTQNTAVNIMLLDSVDKFSILVNFLS